MRSVWVDRDQAGNIISVYSVTQGGRQLGKIAHDDPEVQAFLNPPEKVITAKELIETVYKESRQFVLIYEMLYEIYSSLPGDPVTREQFDAILEFKLLSNP